MYSGKIRTFLYLACLFLTFSITRCSVKYTDGKIPETKKIPVYDTLHGVVIKDSYRWLEDGDNPEVKEWVKKQEEYSHSYLDTLPQLKWLKQRLNYLWRYDDKGVPKQVIDGERIFIHTKNKEDEHRVYNTKANDTSKMVELLNPNKWGPNETLDIIAPSRDGKYVAFGKAIGGNESPVVRIMEVATKKILPDTLRGWRQGGISWLPDNKGFFYTANPGKGEVPQGEEYYWHSVYYHQLGSPSSSDKKVFYSDSVKEYYHYAQVSENGKHVIFYRSRFNENEVYFRKVGSNGPLKPLAEGFDASYSVSLIGDKFLIKTDKNAPMEKVYITDVEHPGRENWKLFLPERNDKLRYVKAIDGHVYAAYLHNAYTMIEIYSIDGKFMRELKLPCMGTAYTWGYWKKGPAWVTLTSHTFPRRTYKYDYMKDSLILYHKPPLDIDVSKYTSKQVWYESEDGTRISMFLIHNKDIKKDGKNPVLLTGYGGFGVSMVPMFQSTFTIWLESGGMIAIPNLRGGGEYGEKWHIAGMRENKQNVFDDFIAAAEWLIENNYTNREKLAISGGSNGGLLVGAVMVQRPELFKAVLCSVPLLDMLRYHKFGYANVWREEYGSAENPEQFKYLYEYSPYHNVKKGIEYPATIITGGENDARVNPLHARKMVAALQDANEGKEPVLLLIRKDSGHGGGTTISSRIKQRAQVWAFLMNELGMETPYQ